MKTKDVIKKLQENDPSGELECCMHNAGIIDVDVTEAYYDGALEVIKTDERGCPVSGKFVRCGLKVSLRTMDIEDAIYNYQDDFTVEYDECCNKNYPERVAKYRQQAIDIRNQVEREHFVIYVQDLLKGYPWTDTMQKDVVEYYNTNMDRNDPMPKDIPNGSWHERREWQWERELKILIVNQKIQIQKKEKHED